MKLVISGKYSIIDNLIKETEFVNTGVIMLLNTLKLIIILERAGKVQ